MGRELGTLTNGTRTDGKGIRLGEWLDQWLEGFGARVGERHRSPKTLAVYRSHVFNFWKPQLGHVLLRDLREATSSKPLPGWARDRPSAGSKVLQAARGSSARPARSTVT
jgi:hypothetical protein